MKLKLLFFVILLKLSNILVSQEQNLNINMADFNYTNGKYKEAIELYEKEIPKIKFSRQNYLNLSDCYRNINDYKKAFNILEKGYNKYHDNMLLTMIALLFDEQKNVSQAEIYFQKVIASQNNGILDNDKVDILTVLVKKQKFNHALKIIDDFEKRSRKNEYLSFLKGEIYAQMGELEKMIDFYVSLVEENRNIYDNPVKIKIYRLIFYNEINKSMVIDILKNRTSKNSEKIAYMSLLCWILQQDFLFEKAFPLAKSLYLRKYWNLTDFYIFGNEAFNKKDYKTAKKVFQIIDDSYQNNYSYEFEVKRMLIKSEFITLEENLTPENLKLIESKYLDILKKYNITNQTGDIVIDYAYFIAYNLKLKNNSTSLLDKIIKDLIINSNLKAKALLAKGDIYSFNNDFINASLEYSRAEKLGKRTHIEDEAKFKSAKISYYNGDFKWAKHQLNVFKKNTTRETCNDALYLSLLIYDNMPIIVDDSISDSNNENLITPLKLYAKADLFKEQKNYKKAFDMLNEILLNYKDNEIFDEALLSKATLYEETNDFINAEKLYLELTEKFPYEFTATIGAFNLAKMYLNNNNTLKAKKQLEKIIFDNSNSIFFSEARELYNSIK